MKKILISAMLALSITAGIQSQALATSRAQAEAIYAQWLNEYANHHPDNAIAMTTGNFIMVYNESVMDRSQALTFTQGLSDFITSRSCTNRVVTDKNLPGDARLLLSRVDCHFNTVSGPLDAYFYETIIVNDDQKIIYDHFTDIAAP